MSGGGEGRGGGGDDGDSDQGGGDDGTHHIGGRVWSALSPDKHHPSPLIVAPFNPSFLLCLRQTDGETDGLLSTDAFPVDVSRCPHVLGCEVCRVDELALATYDKELRGIYELECSMASNQR